MTTQSETASESPLSRDRISFPSRPFYWSLRRELWENRSIYIAPLIAAGVALFGVIVSNRGLARHVSEWRMLDGVTRAAKLGLPYHIASFVIVFTGLIVALAYCLGAVHGERRDRSILFWKSLPVSDVTAVLAKAAVPMLAIPAVTLVIVLATHLVILVLNALDLLAHGQSIAPLWTDLPLARMEVVLVYGLTVLSLWYAPIYGWLLLVSAWARRVTFLWAILPPIALCILEGLAFGTSNVSHMLADRLGAGVSEAFAYGGAGAERGAIGEHMSRIDVIGFLTMPGLWIGLIVAAGFLAATAWLRRRREPI